MVGENWQGYIQGQADGEECVADCKKKGVPPADGLSTLLATNLELDKGRDAKARAQNAAWRVAVGLMLGGDFFRL